MNNQETTGLCRYVRALCPQQKFDEYTPDAWHDILGTYHLADAREAANRVGRRQPFIAPAEIAAEIRALREERLEGFVYQPASGDETPAQYLANLRSQREAVASGRRPANPEPRTAIEAGETPLTPALEGIGQTIPDTDDRPEHKSSPLSVHCPKCQARVGRHCRWPRGGRRPTHPARIRQAEGTLPDPTAEQAAVERRAAAAAYLNQLTPEQRHQLDQFQQQLTGEAS